MLKSIICILVPFLLCSCAAQEEKSDQVEQHEVLITFQDEMGRSLALERVPKRILPLCGSSMEFLILLCDTAEIIGRTPECTSPDWVFNKPVVVNYPLDLEKIMQLKPDLIVSKEGMISNEQLEKLESLGMKVYMQKANTLSDIVKSVSRLGLILGKEEKGTQEAHLLTAQLDSLTDACSHIKGSALALVGPEPLYAFGVNSYMSDVFRVLGLHNAIDSSVTQRYPAVDQEYILKLNPDYLILSLSLKTNSSIFQRYPLLKKLKAYQKGQCIYVDDDWLSRPSPLLLKGARRMMKTICEHEEK